MKKKFWILGLLLGAVVMSALVDHGSDADLVDQNWLYADGKLSFGFVIKNKNADNIAQRIKITAFRERMIGDGAVVLDIIGEKSINIGLGPKEVLKVEETMPLLLNMKPSRVTFKQFKAQAR